MSATITWLGHSAFRLELPDERVLFIDPWLAENPSCPAEWKKPKRCDLILLTHGHFDHVGDTKALIESFDPVVIANYDLCTVLTRLYGRGNFSGMNTGGTQTVDGVRVSMTKAYHSSGVDAPDGPLYGGMPNGVVVDVPGLASIYHAGDTDVFGDMVLIAQLFAPKICILPIGDRFTMGARGASMAVELLQPEAILPCHYKTFPLLAQNADDFRAALPAEYRDRLHTPDAGESLVWTAKGIG